VVAALPKGTTGKPDRIGLGQAWLASSRLPVLSAAGQRFCTWDAGELGAARSLDLTARPIVGADTVGGHGGATTPPLAANASGGSSSLSLGAIRTASKDVLARMLLAAADGLSMGGGGSCVTPDRTLHSLGFDSMMATQLHENLRAAFAVDIPNADLLAMTVANLADDLASRLSFRPPGSGSGTESTDSKEAKKAFIHSPEGQVCVFFGFCDRPACFSRSPSSLDISVLLCMVRVCFQSLFFYLVFVCKTAYLPSCCSLLSTGCCNKPPPSWKLARTFMAQMRS
jgi:hypothetical protein